MTIKQLQNWLFQNSLEDQWWVSVHDSTEQFPKSLSKIEQDLVVLDSKHYGEVKMKVLHVSQAEMINPPWVELEQEKSPDSPPLSQTPVSAVPSAPTRKAVPTSNIVIAYILAVVFPIFGIIAGIILLAKGDGGNGAGAIILSVLAAIVNYSIFFAGS